MFKQSNLLQGQEALALLLFKPVGHPETENYQSPMSQNDIRRIIKNVSETRAFFSKVVDKVAKST